MDPSLLTIIAIFMILVIATKDDYDDFSPA
jgi:hypothetical protein